MKTYIIKLTISLLALNLVVSPVNAKSKHSEGYQNSHRSRVAYAQVTSVKPIYHEVRISDPVRECWKEPVTHRNVHRHGGNTAGSTLAGGIIGGIIGHQIGRGRGNRMATMMGTAIGASIGHNSAVKNSSSTYTTQVTSYEEHCEIEHQVSYEDVLDGYEVSYRYKGKSYQTEMPYDPGKKLKVRVTVEPIF